MISLTTGSGQNLLNISVSSFALRFVFDAGICSRPLMDPVIDQRLLHTDKPSFFSCQLYHVSQSKAN